jgi:hypothetical protein
VIFMVGRMGPGAGAHEVMRAWCAARTVPVERLFKAFQRERCAPLSSACSASNATYQTEAATTAAVGGWIST